MLSHGNQGKYLSKRFHEATDEYYDDPDGFDDDLKTWMDYSTVEHAGEKNEKWWLIETQPPEWPEQSIVDMIDVRRVKRVED